MLICPTCKEHFEGEEHFCPRDGSPLVDAAHAEAGRPKAADPLIGRVLSGRYRLEQRLGQGGMGTVYRAVHTLMDKPVAVKILRAEMAADSEAVARFHREARSASRLDHDHCIRVTDFGQSDDGLLFLVMELLDGVSLGQVCRRGPVPAPRAAAIGIAIAEALAHAHEAGIIHRDLKPDNVFLARRARGRELVKVLDFGLAKLVHDASIGPSITRDGTVFGTPEYMAPEQAEGEKLDGRTDLYALGIILYQLVTGDVPFRASNFVALLTKQVSDRPLPPRERRPDLEIPEAMEAIILRCLAKRREERFASAGELAEALEPLAAGDSSQLMLLPRTDPSSGRRLPQATTPVTGETQTVASPLASPLASPTGSSMTSIDRPSQRLRSGDSDPYPKADLDGDGSPDSVLRGELSERLPRRSRLPLVLALGGILVAGGAAALGWLGRRPLAPPPPRPVVTPAAAPEAPLARAERLLSAGQLAEADQLLRKEREKADSVAMQELMAQLAERRGGPLWRADALGHLEHAARLSPKDAEPRARLAALLYRLGQTGHACKIARAAVQLDPAGGRSGPAREVLKQAHCAQ